MSENEGHAAGVAQQYEYITVTDGPEVSGKSRVKFGRVGKREVLTENWNATIAEEPVKYVELPREMGPDEIRSWLEEDDRGEELLEKFSWGEE